MFLSLWGKNLIILCQQTNIFVVWKYNMIFFSFDRLGRMQWNNVKTFFLGWAGSGPNGNRAEINPKMKSGHDRPKNLLPTSLGSAQPCELDCPVHGNKRLVNQLIIFICCRTWIAHVLHANEDNREEGDREREKITWNEGAWLLGWRWWRLGSPMELLYASSSRCRDTNLGVFSPPRRFAPLFVFFLPRVCLSF